jgi:hypothetical protein
MTDEPDKPTKTETKFLFDHLWQRAIDTQATEEELNAAIRKLLEIQAEYWKAKETACL